MIIVHEYDFQQYLRLAGLTDVPTRQQWRACILCERIGLKFGVHFGFENAAEVYLRTCGAFVGMLH